MNDYEGKETTINFNGDFKMYGVKKTVLKSLYLKGHGLKLKNGLITNIK